MSEFGGLEKIVKKFPKGKSSHKKHDWMVYSIRDYLLKNTNPVGVFTNFELIREKEGIEYVAGDVDVLAIYEEGIIFFGVASGRPSEGWKNYQGKKESGIFLSDICGVNIKYFQVVPGKIVEKFFEVEVY